MRGPRRYSHLPNFSNFLYGVSNEILISFLEFLPALPNALPLFAFNMDESCDGAYQTNHLLHVHQHKDVESDAVRTNCYINGLQVAGMIWVWSEK